MPKSAQDKIATGLSLADATRRRDYGQSTHHHDINSSFASLLIRLAKAYFPDCIVPYSVAAASTIQELTLTEASVIEAKVSHLDALEISSGQAASSVLPDNDVIPNPFPQVVSIDTREQTSELAASSALPEAIASKPMEKAINDYLAFASLSQQAKDYLKNKFAMPLSKDFDRTILTMQIGKKRVSTAWWLPLRETFAIVITALQDNTKWPLQGDMDALKERQLRLDDFALVLEDLAENQKAMCSTGVRHTWLNCLQGYEGQSFAMHGDLFITQCTNEYLKELPEVQAYFNDTEEFKDLVQWLETGITPKAIMDALGPYKEKISEKLYQYIKQQYLEKLGMDLDNKDDDAVWSYQVKVTGNCHKDSLAVLLMRSDVSIGPPWFDELLAWFKEYHFNSNLSSSLMFMKPLIGQVITWLKTEFSYNVNKDAPSSSSSSSSATSTSYDRHGLFSHTNAITISDHDRLSIIFRLFAIWKNIEKNRLLYSHDAEDLHRLIGVFDSFKQQAMHYRLMAIIGNASLTSALIAFEQAQVKYQLTGSTRFIEDICKLWKDAELQEEQQFTEFQRANLFNNLLGLAIHDEAELKHKKQDSSYKPSYKIFIPDDLLRQLQNQHAEQPIRWLEGSYWPNRVLLHALNVSVTEWSPLFYQELEAVIDAINNVFILTAGMGTINMSLESYPLELLTQVQYLMDCYLAEKENKAYPPQLGEEDIYMAGLNFVDIDSRRILVYLGCHAQHQIEGYDLLLRRGLNLNIRSTNYLPLVQAVDSKNSILLQWLLEHGANPNLPGINNQFRSPLMLAIEKYNTSDVELLLKHNANPNGVGGLDFSYDYPLESPLHNAVEKKLVLVVERLIACGANLEKRDIFKRRPYDIALAEYRDSSGLFKDLRTESILQLLDVDLKYTVFKGDLENFYKKLPLQPGLVNKKHEFGYTLLLIAVLHGHSKLVEALIAAGADVNIPNDNGWTPLWLAVRRGDIPMVACLLKAGANTELSNKSGWTPLWMAVSHENKAVSLPLVNMLLDEGANMEALSPDGQTPLMAAAEEGAVDYVQLLLSRGANKLVRDGAGKTALDLAKAQAQTEVIRLLEGSEAACSSGAHTIAPVLHSSSIFELSVSNRQDQSGASSSSYFHGR